ncbi:hypothetical protein D3C87_1875110 [compost metagenome]
MGALQGITQLGLIQPEDRGQTPGDGLGGLLEIDRLSVDRARLDRDGEFLVVAIDDLAADRGQVDLAGALLAGEVRQVGGLEDLQEDHAPHQEEGEEGEPPVDPAAAGSDDLGAGHGQ